MWFKTCFECRHLLKLYFQVWSMKAYNFGPDDAKPFLVVFKGTKRYRSCWCRFSRDRIPWHLHQHQELTHSVGHYSLQHLHCQLPLHVLQQHLEDPLIHLHQYPASPQCMYILQPSILGRIGDWDCSLVIRICLWNKVQYVTSQRIVFSKEWNCLTQRHLQIRHNIISAGFCSEYLHS